MPDIPPAPALWCVDFEYRQPAGERPHPWCMCAKEWRSGQEIRLWRNDLLRLRRAPFDTEDAIFCAYNVAAEASCFLALNWPLPRRVVDLYAEFRWWANGRQTLDGSFRLVSALHWFGLAHHYAGEKADLQQEAQIRTDWPPSRRVALLDYCMEDVDALVRLFPRMAADIDWPRALYRGRYQLAMARMQHRGIPIDTDQLGRIRRQGPMLRHRLIASVDQHYGVYEDGHFRMRRFERLLADRHIVWSRLPSGTLEMTGEVWRDMAALHPWLNALRELRSTLDQLEWNGPAVGNDGRNRFGQHAFGTKTGRNAPRVSENVMGLACWARSLVRPVAGTALLHVDWTAQEFALAAVLSGDPQMQADYLAGDPYITFAQRAGLAPPNACKRSHPTIRAACKIATLAGNYGQGVKGLASRLNISEIEARELMQRVAAAYPRHRLWMQRLSDRAAIFGRLTSPFGWRLWVHPNARPGTILNWPLQTLGAELLRIAVIVASEEGWNVVSTMHDSALIEVPIAQAEAARVRIAEIMERASAVATRGFRIRVASTAILPGDRYVDDRGEEMWRRVMRLLDHCEMELAA